VPGRRERRQRRVGVRVRRQRRRALHRLVELLQVEPAAPDRGLERAADVLGERAEPVCERVYGGGVHGSRENAGTEIRHLPWLADRRGIRERAVEVEEDDHRARSGRRRLTAP